jgi:hypothetical protein
MKRLSNFLHYRAAQAVALVMVLLLCQPAIAEQHVLPLTELHDAAVAAEHSRESNRADIDRLLANEKIKQAMAKQNIDASQVHRAIATLSDEDISTLAAKARSFEADLAAGNATLTDAQVTLFLMGFFFLVFMAILVIAFK